MKSILIPVEEHVLIHPVLETALLLGRVLDGYLEGLAITPNTPPYIASIWPLVTCRFSIRSFAVSGPQLPGGCSRRS